MAAEKKNKKKNNAINMCFEAFVEVDSIKKYWELVFLLKKYNLNSLKFCESEFPKNKFIEKDFIELWKKENVSPFIKGRNYYTEI